MQFFFAPFELKGLVSLACDHARRPRQLDQYGHYNVLRTTETVFGSSPTPLSRV